MKAPLFIKTFLCGLMLTLLAYASAVAQTYSISGVVKDKQGPLPGATVFLTGTSYITATDAEGNFKFDNVQPGSYPLVVKMLGYEAYLQQLLVVNASIQVSITLAGSTQQLGEVVVRPDKVWFKNLELFKEKFLGQHATAKQCKILNSEVLDLTYDKKQHVLTAKTDQLLKIENKALGYKLTYLLSSFKYNTQTGKVLYQGYPSFERLAGTPAEEALWKQNRDNAYKGSIQHFMRALYNGNWRQEGFIVWEMKDWLPNGAGYASPRDTSMRRRKDVSASLVTAVDNNYKTVQFTRALYVIYQPADEDAQYQAAGYSLGRLYVDNPGPPGQASIVNLLGPSVLIDSRGAFYRTQDLFFEGYMGWLEISDLNPYGYQPGQ